MADASTMWALTFDREREDWATSTGMVRERLPIPTLDGPTHDEDVLVEVRWAGFCGSDRGIWWRAAFGDLIADSLDTDGAHKRTFGHELLGGIVAVGRAVTARYGYRVGDVVSAESHVYCGHCVPCQLGERHVCTNERILGISLDGCFAQFVRLPAKVLWRTDTDRIRPEVAAIQEPFGNAVHACQQVDLRGRSVAIFGTGTIGLFAVLVARGMGARTVIGIEPDPQNAALAKTLGCDEVLTPGRPPADTPWKADPELQARLRELTDGVGVDVAMEMSGHPSSTNNAIKAARRGGDVVLFGVKNGDAVIQDVHKIVMNGLRLHGVVGRRVFDTWHVTRALLEHTANGVQDAVWDHILHGGEGTTASLDGFDRDAFEAQIKAHPKVLLRCS